MVNYAIYNNTPKGYGNVWLNKPAPAVGELECVPDLNDIIVWPDGTMCFAYDLGDFTFMSDDYRRVYHGSTEYEALYLNM